MSAVINIGNKMPVDAFSPKTKANSTTMIIPMPLIPDFAKPNKNPAKATATHCSIARLYDSSICR